VLGGAHATLRLQRLSAAVTGSGSAVRVQAGTAVDRRAGWLAGAVPGLLKHICRRRLGQAAVKFVILLVDNRVFACICCFLLSHQKLGVVVAIVARQNDVSCQVLMLIMAHSQPSRIAS